ncbi:MAG: hypothetical protein RL190_1546, partial [Actinomycetota bacterium]
EARELGGEARVELGGAAPVLAHAGQVGALHAGHPEPPERIGVLALGHPPEQDLAARVWWVLARAAGSAEAAALLERHGPDAP